MALIPPPLEPGDCIGVIAPAGYLSEPEFYHQGCEILRDMGFTIYEPDKSWPGWGYLADRDEARLAELHRMFAEPEVKAIFALRGGFGSLRLLGKIDLALIQNNPKLFFGFSDITILHNHLFDRTGLICMHGPGLASLCRCEEDSLDRLYQCLRGNWQKTLTEPVEHVRSCESVGDITEGPLLGGNLASLATLLGTPWFPDLTRAVLLLEDVNEPLYRLDRLLSQLWFSGATADISAIILGQFGDEDTGELEQLRRHEFVWNRVRELTAAREVPIWGNFPVGHTRKNLTLPIGAWCRMDHDKGCIHFSVKK